MKRIIILIVFGFSALSVLGQHQSLGVGYQMSIPMGKLHDYVSSASFRGAAIDYHYYLFEYMSVGGSVGWNVFYKDQGTETDDFYFKGSDNLYTITGKQYRYVNTVPIMLNARYHINGSSGLFQPYGGLSIGMRWTELKLEIGQFESKLSRWQFAVSPEIGTLIDVNDMMNINCNLSYNFSTRAANGRIPTYNTLMFTVGVVLFSPF